MGSKTTEAEARNLMKQVGLQPIEKFVSNSSKWKSKCIKCKRINTRSLKSVKKFGRGCTYCSGKAVDPKEAKAFMMQQGMKPLEPYTNSTSKWKCKCLKCARIIYPTYKSSSNKRRMSGCPYCKKTKVDLKEVLEKLKEYDLEPLEPYKSAMTKWKCKCLRCGEVVHPMWASIQNQGSRCKYCSGNSITAKRANTVMKSAGYQPLEPYKDNKSKWKSIHLKCGSIVYPKLNTISSGVGGCRNCAEIGFEVRKPAFVYLMKHRDYESLKVGIGNQDSKPNRIEVHKKFGWETIFVHNFDLGWKALSAETKFFRWLRVDQKIPHHLSKSEMPQSGRVETFAEDLISEIEALRVLKRIIEKNDV